MKLNYPAESAKWRDKGMVLPLLDLALLSPPPRICRPCLALLSDTFSTSIEFSAPVIQHGPRQSCGKISRRQDPSVSRGGAGRRHQCAHANASHTMDCCRLLSPSTRPWKTLDSSAVKVDLPGIAQRCCFGMLEWIVGTRCRKV